MRDTYAYADGYGRWHVLTRDTPRGLTRAIDRMAAEIHARRDTINMSTTRASRASRGDEHRESAALRMGRLSRFRRRTRSARRVASLRRIRNRLGSPLRMGIDRMPHTRKNPNTTDPGEGQNVQQV